MIVELESTPIPTTRDRSNQLNHIIYLVCADFLSILGGGCLTEDSKLQPNAGRGIRTHHLADPKSAVSYHLDYSRLMRIARFELASTLAS